MDLIVPVRLVRLRLRRPGCRVEPRATRPRGSEAEAKPKGRPPVPCPPWSNRAASLPALARRAVTCSAGPTGREKALSHGMITAAWARGSQDGGQTFPTPRLLPDGAAWEHGGNPTLLRRAPSGWIWPGWKSNSPSTTIRCTYRWAMGRTPRGPPASRTVLSWAFVRVGHGLPAPPHVTVSPHLDIGGPVPLRSVIIYHDLFPGWGLPSAGRKRHAHVVPHAGPKSSHQVITPHPPTPARASHDLAVYGVPSDPTVPASL